MRSCKHCGSVCAPGLQMHHLCLSHAVCSSCFAECIVIGDFFLADYSGQDRKFNSLPRGNEVYGNTQRAPPPPPAQGRDAGMGRSVDVYDTNKIDIFYCVSNWA